MTSTRRRVDSSAVSAFLPVVAVIPLWLLALAVVWLPLRVVWHISFVTLALDVEGWWGTLMSQPAVWSVPVGFGLMVGVSLATRARVPANVGRTMVRLHTPERVQVDRRF